MTLLTKYAIGLIQVISSDVIAGSKVHLTIYYIVFKGTCKEIILRLFLVSIIQVPCFFFTGVPRTVLIALGLSTSVQLPQKLPWKVKCGSKSTFRVTTMVKTDNYSNRRYF